MLWKCGVVASLKVGRRSTTVSALRTLWHQAHRRDRAALHIEDNFTSGLRSLSTSNDGRAVLEEESGKEVDGTLLGMEANAGE